MEADELLDGIEKEIQALGYDGLSTLVDFVGGSTMKVGSRPPNRH